MPYDKVRNHPGCPAGKPWAVVKVGGSQPVGCHATEDDANAQLAALHINVKAGTQVTETLAKVMHPDAKGNCPEGYNKMPNGVCLPANASAALVEMFGGYPNQGTPKDKRLKRNKSEGDTVEMAGPMMPKSDMPKGDMPQDDCPPGQHWMPDMGKCMPDAEMSIGRWKGPLVVENVTTGDGREFAEGALTWDEPPIPLRWNKEDSHGGEPRTVAVNVGRIDRIWREDNQIMGAGVFNLDEEDGQRAYKLVKGKFLKGISVDVDNMTDTDVELIWPEKPVGTEKDDELDMLTALFGRPEKTVFHGGRIRAATLCDIPAFTQAYVELDDEVGDVPTTAFVADERFAAVGPHSTSTSDGSWDAGVNEKRLPSPMPETTARSAYAWIDTSAADGGKLPKTAGRFIHHEINADGSVGPANLTACSTGIGVLHGGRGGTTIPAADKQGVYNHLAAHLRSAGQEPPPFQSGITALVAHAGGDDWRPPSSWFENPELNQLVPIMVTDEGRVYGHAAQWGECHLGFGDTCIMAPREDTHPYFLTGEVVCAEGEHVPVGQIFTRAPHASLSMSPTRATEHYENTGYVVADVTCGNDRHGIWVAGAVRSDALATRVNELRASGQVSPDWRRIGGQLRMVGLLVVNVSGYQVPRPRARMFGGQVQALVAAGVVPMGGAAAHDAERRALEAVVAQLANQVHS